MCSHGIDTFENIVKVVASVPHRPWGFSRMSLKTLGRWLIKLSETHPRALQVDAIGPPSDLTCDVTASMDSYWMIFV